MGGWCTECREWHVDGEACKPTYEYNIPDYYDDEWYKVKARGFIAAAERACDIEDSDGDYTIITAGSLSLIQIRDDKGKIKKFTIEAEAVPEYHASEIKKEGAE